MCGSDQSLLPPSALTSRDSSNPQGFSAAKAAPQPPRGEEFLCQTPWELLFSAVCPCPGRPQAPEHLSERVVCFAKLLTPSPETQRSYTWDRQDLYSSYRAKNKSCFLLFTSTALPLPLFSLTHPISKAPPQPGPVQTLTISYPNSLCAPKGDFKSEF